MFVVVMNGMMGLSRLRRGSIVGCGWRRLLLQDKRLVASWIPSFLQYITIWTCAAHIKLVLVEYDFGKEPEWVAFSKSSLLAVSWAKVPPSNDQRYVLISNCLVWFWFNNVFLMSSSSRFIIWLLWKVSKQKVYATFHPECPEACPIFEMSESSL